MPDVDEFADLAAEVDDYPIPGLDELADCDDDAEACSVNEPWEVTE